MKNIHGVNKPVDYLVRNPKFLTKLREALFPHPDQPESTRPCSRRKGSLEREYHIRLPDRKEFASFQECLELIRRRNASGWCVEPLVSANPRALTESRRARTCSGQRVRAGNWDGKDSHASDEERPVTVRIDLRLPKEQVLTHVSVCYDVLSGMAGKRDFRWNRRPRINDLTVWDEYLLERSFTRIARKHKWNVSAVRSAYYRAFVRIMGEPYNPDRHSRKRLTREQLRRTCETCSDNPCRGGHCNSLCASARAYVDQDSVASPFVADRSESVLATERHSPAKTYETRRLLSLVSLM